MIYLANYFLSGIGVATGEMCQNRVMFKQFLVSGGMQFCQVKSDKRRSGAGGWGLGINENKKYLILP